MIKIGGKYKQLDTEELLSHINNEDSISKRHHLLSRYFRQRSKQIEKILANIDDDDIHYFASFEVVKKGEETTYCYRYLGRT